MVQVELWRVFPRGAIGGNPCPLVTNAGELTSRQMLAISAHYGHESAFVTSVSGSTVALRYFVPATRCAYAFTPRSPPSPHSSAPVAWGRSPRTRRACPSGRTAA